MKINLLCNANGAFADEAVSYFRLSCYSGMCISVSDTLLGSADVVESKQLEVQDEAESHLEEREEVAAGLLGEFGMFVLVCVGIM